MEVNIEAIIGIIMSDEKLVDYINSLVRNKLSSNTRKTLSTNKQESSIIQLIDNTIDDAIEDIKLLDLIRDIKAQVIRKNRTPSRSKHNQQTKGDDQNSRQKWATLSEQNGRVSNSDIKLSATMEPGDFDVGSNKKLPIFSTSEPIPIKATSPKRIVKNVKQAGSMVRSVLNLQKSSFLKESDSIHSDDITVSKHRQQSSFLAESGDIDSDSCSIDVTGSRGISNSSYLVSSISDDSAKKEVPVLFLNGFHREEQRHNKFRESVDQSVDSLDFKNFSSKVAAEAAPSVADSAGGDPSAIHQLSSEFRSLLSSTEVDGELDSNSKPATATIADNHSEELKLKSWEEKVASNLAMDQIGENVADSSAAADSESKPDDLHPTLPTALTDEEAKHLDEVTKEHLENGTVCSEIKPIKSILCKVSKVKDVDEDDYDFSQSNTERNIRVNFISGCVAEIHFRDKVTKLEQPTLFYTHVEEYQFSADLGLEQERAEEMGMTWLEWIEQRTDEDVQRDDEEADNIRRRMEEENGISPEGYDDDNFEDNFEDTNNSSSMFRGGFHPSETVRSLLLKNDDFQVEYDDEIDDDDFNNNNNNNNNSNNHNSFNHSTHSRVSEPKGANVSREHGPSSRYTLDESYGQDFEFDTEDIPEDDDF